MTKPYLLLLALFVGCGLPNPPAEHTNASLQNYFGDSPSTLVDSWGKPSSIVKTEHRSPPENPTDEELAKFKAETIAEEYIYPTANGELRFQLNLNEEVCGIMYENKAVPKPN